MNRDYSNYAELIIKQGINLKKGELLAISSPVLAAPLAEAVAEQAYKNGASKVVMFWGDEKISRLAFEYADEKDIVEVPDYVVASRDYVLDNNGAYVCICSDIPGIYDGISAKLVSEKGKATNKALHRFRESTSINKTRWCLVAYPNVKWAEKMFPELKGEAAEQKQWEYMEKTLRLDEKDFIKAWDKHQDDLQRRSKFLNDAKIVKFHYKNSIGTDFTIGMPKNYIFTGAGEKSQDGVMFTANMPTEEVFASPDCRTAEGTLVAAMPLVRNGVIMENFSITFEKGRVVDFKAEKGYDALKEIIETDEGSHRLGEIALIGYDSPIRKLGALFYMTLFDENQSCHFALGRAFPTCVEGGDNMTKEQQAEVGLNTSLTHVDFMVGTPDLDITAYTEDGKELAIFRNGNWVI